MVDRRTGKPLPSLRWYFTGSAFRQPDPNKDYKVYGADLAGTLIAIFPVTDETVFQTNLTMKESTLLRLETNRNVLPDEGTAVRLIIQVSPPPQSFDTAASQAFAPVPLPLFVTAPQPSPSSALVPAPRGTWRPPLADVLRLPRLLPSEHDRPVRPRPVADLPLLGRGSPSLPPPRLPPATPQARAASPDPNRLPLLPAGSRPNPNHADATSDPTLGQARQALLWTIGGLRRSPAPFLRLTIPDPFEAVTAVQFRHCPADDDTPAVLPDLPGRPTLTVKP